MRKKTITLLPNFLKAIFYQIELAAKVAGRNNNCADHFMAFLLAQQLKKEIALYNTMLFLSAVNQLNPITMH